MKQMSMSNSILSNSTCYVIVVMYHITLFQSTTDHVYSGGPIRLEWSGKISITWWLCSRHCSATHVCGHADVNKTNLPLCQLDKSVAHIITVVGYTI